MSSLSTNCTIPLVDILPSTIYFPFTYSLIVEDPSKIQAAAEVSVDVLFVAFEKFLRKAWTERLGSVIGSKMLVDLQSILGNNCVVFE